MNLNKFKLEVEADRAVDKLKVVKTDLGTKCRVNEKKMIQIAAYDRFNNLIENVETEKMDLH